MKRVGTSFLLIVGLAACAPAARLQPASPGPQIAGDGTCRAEGLQWAIGQAATQDTMGRLWKDSGAGLVRPIGPGQPTRRDRRGDRLNVHIDKANLITAVDCG